MTDLSIVIPLYNEDESILELHSKIVSSLSNSSLNYEIIFIDDGSSDSHFNPNQNKMDLMEEEIII